MAEVYSLINVLSLAFTTFSLMAGFLSPLEYFNLRFFTRDVVGFTQKRVIDRKCMKRIVSGKYVHDSHLKLIAFHSRMCLTTCALRLTITTFKRLKTPFPGLAERTRMPVNLPTELFPHHRRHRQHLEEESNRLQIGPDGFIESTSL